MKQPLNEAYKNEILEAYQKISDTFDDFTQLIRKRVPYEQWPDHCKIAGVNPEMLGCSHPNSEIRKIVPPPEPMRIPDFPQEMLDLCQDPIDDLEKIILEGWRHVQSDCRPDESFRAMLKVMLKWKVYLESKQKKEEAQTNIWDILKAQGMDPTKAFSMGMISRIEDIGRAQNKLKTILDNDVFDTLSKHNPYWHSEHDIEADKLDEVRRQLSCLNDNLWDLWAVLRQESEE